MKFTKKSEAEVLKAYHSYWDSYLKGDMETFGNLLDENCHIIGSTSTDIFTNKKDAVDFYTATSNQVAGITEFRNRKIEVLPNGSSVMVNEFCDYFFLNDGTWNFYAHGRMSTLLSRIDGNWKIVHQHGSLPDTRAGEGQQVGIEKISEENRLLKDAVKRRTVELEHKSRELEVEAALERVRAIAMAMIQAEDMLKVCRMIAKQLELLKVQGIRNVQTAIIYEEQGTYLNYEFYVKHDKTFITEVDYKLHQAQFEFVNSMLKGPEEFFSKHFTGNEVQDWYAYQQTTNQFADFYLAEATSLNYYWYSMGPVALGMSTYIPLTTEDIILFKRFRNVFELAYRRFMDIEQASAQKREAEIQLALERVRARTMAMRQSDELAETASLLFQQIKDLGFETWSCGFCIWKENEIAEAWMGAEAGGLLPPLMIPYKEEPTHRDIYEASLQNKTSHEAIWEGKALEAHYDFLRTIPSVKIAIEQLEQAGSALPPRQCYYVGFFKHGYLLIITTEPKSEALDISKRFAGVFDLTYTRFLDLQKAEEQAIESKIELALERVRARAMAMQHSEELADASFILVQQVQSLGIKVWGCAFNIYDENENSSTEWFSNSEGSFPTYKTPREGLFLRYYETGQQGETLYVEEISGQTCVDHYEYLCTLPIVGDGLKKMKEAGIAFPTAQIDHVAYFKFGYLLFITFEPAIHAYEIFKRFARVFEQTYTRFLDLQKAEEQAKEAQIEASLERVRAKAMAMHHSDELDEVLTVLFEQFDVLGINPLSTHMTLIDVESNTFTFRETGKAGRRSYGEQVVPIDSMDIWKDAADRWKSHEPLSINSLHFPVEMLPTVWQVFHESFASMPDDAKIYPEDYPDGLYHTAGNCKFGYIGMNQVRKPTAEEEQIVVKFATEFGRLYQRFLDLKQAEAQAKEARIEAALERVRSKAMAMHSSEDLTDTIAVFYHELELFSITPRRCGVGLINKDDRSAELSTMNTTELGKSIEIVGTIQLENHPVLEKVFENWLLRKDYHPVLRGNEIKEYYQLLRPQIAFPEYPADTVQYGYFFFFPEGGVYAWTDKMLLEDELIIYRRFTSVLSLTYKRFKDLQHAEGLADKAESDLVLLKEEKKRTEEALAELQVTQKQLIQAEKMASLGELTAGIAHEIQNPLNFVNNFSEVSNELLDEMLEEVAKGNFDEVKSIVEDVKQNLEKINHHGRRADGIVKGMLQHSQSSSGQKELTDINALADEYLRLSYHGIRAKNKSFNAQLKTEFDEKVGSVSIIPQDLGRVILNLINNAFYTVDEKRNTIGNDYQPTVTVGSKKEKDNILIIIKDNGKGIPPKVLEKMFQPFFTTKPTGQGTGLGLSLAYDIVKAHDGVLKVETKENEGTTFTIQLPNTGK